MSQILLISALFAGPLFGATSAHACLSSSEARSVIKSGAAISLSAASKVAARQVGGEVVKASLCQSGGNYVYVLNILGSSGAVKKATVDAASGSVLSIQ